MVDIILKMIAYKYTEYISIYTQIIMVDIILKMIA